MPVVSVIIPSYNYADYIGRAIDSVLSQSFHDLEIIVVDDASTDNTHGVIDQFNDQRIFYIRHEVNQGPNAARNTGILHSRGSLLAFLDSDDFWMPDKLKLQIEYFNHGSANLGAVFTGIKIFDKHTNQYNVLTNEDNIAYGLKDILRGNLLGSSSAIIHARCFKTLGLFDTTMRYCEDWDNWIRIAAHFEIGYLRQVLVECSRHSGNISLNRHGILAGRAIILKKHRTVFLLYPDIFCKHHYVLGLEFYKDGFINKGREHFLTAFKYAPVNNMLKFKSFIRYCMTIMYFKTEKPYEK